MQRDWGDQLREVRIFLECQILISRYPASPENRHKFKAAQIQSCRPHDDDYFSPLTHYIWVIPPWCLFLPLCCALGPTNGLDHPRQGGEAH